MQKQKITINFDLELHAQDYFYLGGDVTVEFCVMLEEYYALNNYFYLTFYNIENKKQQQKIELSKTINLTQEEIRKKDDFCIASAIDFEMVVLSQYDFYTDVLLIPSFLNTLFITFEKHLKNICQNLDLPQNQIRNKPKNKSTVEHYIEIIALHFEVKSPETLFPSFYKPIGTVFRKGRNEFSHGEWENSQLTFSEITKFSDYFGYICDVLSEIQQTVLLNPEK